MNEPNTQPSQETPKETLRSPDRFGAVRDPGATPRRKLKNDNIAVVHSSDVDSEPNSEIYEAYEDEEPRSR